MAERVSGAIERDLLGDDLVGLAALAHRNHGSLLLTWVGFWKTSALKVRKPRGPFGPRGFRCVPHSYFVLVALASRPSHGEAKALHNHDVAENADSRAVGAVALIRVVRPTVHEKSFTRRATEAVMQKQPRHPIRHIARLSSTN